MSITVPCSVVTESDAEPYFIFCGGKQIKQTKHEIQLDPCSMLE